MLSAAFDLVWYGPVLAHPAARAVRAVIGGRHALA